MVVELWIVHPRKIRRQRQAEAREIGLAGMFEREPRAVVEEEMEAVAVPPRS